MRSSDEVYKHHHKSKRYEMKTPPKKQKDQSHRSKKKYKQREEAKECDVKDAEISQSKQQPQTEKCSDDKDHYHGIEHHHYLVRERRRKSRSERNKRRERCKQTSQQKTDSKEQSEFRRHVRRAQEITSRSSADQPKLNVEAKPVTVITQNRLTRKLGLFNQGKKSSKILRETILVPESVQSRVEKDLKEIINHKSSTEAHSVISVNESIQQSYKSLPCESIEHTSSHQSCHLPTTPSSATKPSPSRSWATTSPESQISGITRLPESPPWEEISKDFEESLNIDEIFPDKEDYLSTVYRDLKKMIETYGSSQETRSQPSALRKNEIPPKVSKLSVRRRLEDAFAKEEEMMQDRVPTTADNSTVTEFVGKEGLKSVTEKGLEEMPYHETGLRRLRNDNHRHETGLRRFRNEDRQETGLRGFRNENHQQETGLRGIRNDYRQETGLRGFRNDYRQETELRGFRNENHQQETELRGLRNEDHRQETGLKGFRNEDHRKKKKVMIMETIKVVDKKASTEELMNAMMDGLQFLKNADEVNKIWSTSRSKTNSQDLHVNSTSESNFYQSQSTDTSKGTSAPQRRQQQSYITERHHSETVGIGQEYFTSCSGDRVNPVMGSDYHQKDWRRSESLNSHRQQRKDQEKSDMRMKNVSEDIFASSMYHHPSVSSSHVTYAPVGNSPRADMSHDHHLMCPQLRRRGRYPFKRFRMMESSDTDDDEDEDDDLFPSWYMDVHPPKLPAIESPKFYPQKMF